MELENEFGRVIKPKELAKLLAVSVNTIRTHHERWGGIEVTPGKYRFFENIIREKIHADIDKPREQEALERRGNGQRDQEGESLQGRYPEKQKRVHRLGKHDQGDAVGDSRGPNRHGLSDFA